MINSGGLHQSDFCGLRGYPIYEGIEVRLRIVGHRLHARSVWCGQGDNWRGGRLCNVVVNKRDLRFKSTSKKVVVVRK